ncbi:MAG: TolC family protein [Chitinophagales bacterium]
MNKILMTFLFLTAFFVGNSQISTSTAWTLQDCIDYAMENNITIQQSSLSLDQAENTVMQSKMNIYTPIINANVSHNFNFSNSIDPLTYEFIQQNTQSTQFSLSGNYSLFEGMSRIHTLKANQEAVTATTYDIEAVKDNTRLLIANYYLQVLVANEVLQVAKEKKTLTENQLSNTQQLVDAGVVAKGDIFNIDAQLANDEMSIVNAEINLEKALNQLKIVLQLDPYQELMIQGFSTEQAVVAEPTPPQSITASAYTFMPSILSSESRLSVAEYQYKAAKGSLSPTISLNGSISTNYFNAAREAIGFENISFPTIGTVQGSGESVVSNIPDGDVVFEDKKFGAQLKDNLGENLSISMSIPIFGKWQRMIAIDNAKINIENAELTIESQKNEVSQNVFNAYTDVSASVKRHQTAEKSVTAAAEAFRYAEEKLNAGVSNSLEFETSKNRLINAQAELIQAKYEYYMRKMILNYYKSGELSL